MYLSTPSQVEFKQKYAHSQLELLGVLAHSQYPLYDFASKSGFVTTVSVKCVQSVSTEAIEIVHLCEPQPLISILYW